MRVLIAGAGIGGLTAALALQARGFEVAVYEHAPALEEVGAGLQLGPNATRVLIRLGLGEALRRVAWTPPAADMRMGDSGRVIFSLPLGERMERQYGAPYYQLHRADLQGLLVEALNRVAPEALHLGKELREVGQSEQGVSFGFVDGDWAKGDLAVGADGVRSVVRQELFGASEVRYTGMAAWRVTVPAERLPSGLVPGNATVWVGEKKHVVTYYLRGGTLVNLVGVVEEDEWPYDGWTSLAGQQDILKDYRGWHPVVTGILEAAGDDIEYFKWALRDLPALPHWSSGRVTLLGDACHPMLPFMAQGAGMAIEDAWVLADCLSSGSGNTAAALRRYEQRRKPRATRLQEVSRRNGKLYHLGTSLSRRWLYAPLAGVSRLAPGFFAGQLDWLYGEDVTRGD